MTEAELKAKLDELATVSLGQVKAAIHTLCETVRAWRQHGFDDKVLEAAVMETLDKFEAPLNAVFDELKTEFPEFGL